MVFALTAAGCLELAGVTVVPFCLAVESAAAAGCFEVALLDIQTEKTSGQRETIEKLRSKINYTLD